MRKNLVSIVGCALLGGVIGLSMGTCNHFVNKNVHKKIGQNDEVFLSLRSKEVTKNVKDLSIKGGEGFDLNFRAYDYDHIKEERVYINGGLIYRGDLSYYKKDHGEYPLGHSGYRSFKTTDKYFTNGRNSIKLEIEDVNGDIKKDEVNVTIVD